MKKIFTLCVLVLMLVVSKAQVVLNEVYPDPGATFQEFFELYNTSTSPTPENLDNYTLVTYYEEPGGKSGFYVLDLPGHTVASKGYYVGSSLSNFAIQGKGGLTAQLNWNAISAGGALTKWEKNGSSYSSVAIPANLNDLFVKITGGGGSSSAYQIFVYKNGMFVNGIMGGSNANVIPAKLKAMPDLFVDMSGSSPDFTINFNTISDNSVEYISGTAGTNNGYYREYDGKCGVWKLSSAATDYTPGQSNGSAANALGELSIATFISVYEPNPYQSVLAYNILSGPADAFPVIVEVYHDLGITGELDANDVLVDSRNIGSASAGSQEVIMPTTTANVILVAKSPAGCFDRVIAISNPASTLPVHLMSFQGNINKNNKVTLAWTVADNETVHSFVVERTTNGRDFTAVGLVFSSEKIGTESYMFYETVDNVDKIMYRLKMIDKRQDVDYSKVLIFNLRASVNNNIKIIGNPVNDKLTFSYTSSSTQPVTLKLYEISGKLLMNYRVNILEGNNTMSVPLVTSFKPGMYVIEINNGREVQTAKFVKQ